MSIQKDYGDSHYILLGILAGGTNLGKIAMWHSVTNKTGAEVEGEMKWELSSPTLVQESVLQLKVLLTTHIFCAFLFHVVG